MTRQVRVLVVDDDSDHAESIADILEDRGYDVSVALSGEAGVASFRESDFDLVFMDMKLPGMNGVETFVEIKKIRADTRVVMMTGYSVEQLAAQAADNGAMGMLRKPFSINDLLSAVDAAKPRGIVLVADDDPLFAESMVGVLGSQGYRVEMATTGEEALEKLAAGGVDCLLLDIRMPILSGLDVYLRMKEEGKLVPTIIVTGHVSDEEANQLSPMTQGLLVKPFDPETLLRAMVELRPEGA